MTQETATDRLASHCGEGLAEQVYDALAKKLRRRDSPHSLSTIREILRTAASIASPLSHLDGGLIERLSNHLPDCATNWQDGDCDCAGERLQLAITTLTRPLGEGEEELAGFAPCPTCKQYSHSIGYDRLAEAFRHFQSMYAHPVRGHPMGHNFDEKTRDAAQVLMAAATTPSSLPIAPSEPDEWTKGTFADKSGTFARPIAPEGYVLEERSDV